MHTTPVPTGLNCELFNMMSRGAEVALAQVGGPDGFLNLVRV